MYHWNLIAWQVAEQREINLIYKRRDRKDMMRLLHQFAVDKVNKHQLLWIRCCIKVNRASGCGYTFLCMSFFAMISMWGESIATATMVPSVNLTNAPRGVQSVLFRRSFMLLSFFLSGYDGIGSIVSFFLSWVIRQPLSGVAHNLALTGGRRGKQRHAQPRCPSCEASYFLDSPPLRHYPKFFAFLGILTAANCPAMCTLSPGLD